MIHNQKRIYQFGKYVTKKRWISFFHQIDEISTLEPDSVLEIGVGSGILGAILKNTFGIQYESLDVNRELKPDYVGSVQKLPFPDRHFDVIACFQVLEHLPYEVFEQALSELFRVSKKAVILSLPNARRILRVFITKICENLFIK